MVEQCRRTVPQAHVVVGDVADLGRSVDGTFDAVVAPDNLIDVFNDIERREVLSGIRDFLAPGGLLIFSSHDLAYLDAHGPHGSPTPTSLPRRLLDTSPADLFRIARRRVRESANRRRLASLQERHETYAVVNDFPHYYSLLHYYIRRDDQERQLNELGFDLLECLDSDGFRVGPGGTGPTDSLYYVARRRP
jgi:SAM-dependent methyltransferase